MGASPHHSSVSFIKGFAVFRAVTSVVFYFLFAIAALAEQLQVPQFTGPAIRDRHKMIDRESHCRATAHTRSVISLPERTCCLGGNIAAPILLAFSAVVGFQIIGAVFVE